jgi:hypothetical protein
LLKTLAGGGDVFVGELPMGADTVAAQQTFL